MMVVMFMPLMVMFMMMFFMVMFMLLMAMFMMMFFMVMVMPMFFMVIQFEIRTGNPDYIGKVVVIAAGYTEQELEKIFLG